MVLMNWYESLALDPTPRNMSILLEASRWDERVYHVLAETTTPTADAVNAAAVTSALKPKVDPRTSWQQDESAAESSASSSSSPAPELTGRFASAAVDSARGSKVTETTMRLQALFNRFPDPDAVRFFQRGLFYPAVREFTERQFVPIASQLARYETAASGSALSDLFGSLARPEGQHLELFNYSETYRHLILSRNLLAQRAVLRLFSFLFSDDFLQDAVSVLQYKSDILNHINRVFVDTADFGAWRYSVRTMSLAGGYNEDRREVLKTDRMVTFVTRSIPEFLLFFATAFAYGMFRFYPRRVQGKIPRWLRRRRALFSGVVCGALGVFSNSYMQSRLNDKRIDFDRLYNQEMRRRRGAEKQKLHYQPNTYFDSLQGVTRMVWVSQVKFYTAIAGALALSCFPLYKVTFPKFMGDVVFRHPWVPTLFPIVVGLPATSRSLVPYIVLPFAAATLIQRQLGCPIYDHYVHRRYTWWRRNRSADALDW